MATPSWMYANGSHGNNRPNVVRPQYDVDTGHMPPRIQSIHPYGNNFRGSWLSGVLQSVGNAVAAGNRAVPNRVPPDGGRDSSGRGSTGGTTQSRTVGRNGVTSSSRATTGGSTGTSRPRTFTNGSGKVRRVQATRPSAAKPGVAKPAVDQLKQLVDEMLSGMNTPLMNDKKTLAEQSAGTTNQTNRLHDYYDQQVAGIQQGANTDLGGMLNRAAELKGLSAETIAKNQEWLKSLMAPTNGGTGAAQVADAMGHTQSDVAAMNDSMARDIAGSGQSLDARMNEYRVAGRAGQRELNQQELLRTQAVQREIDRQIAANNATAPQLRRQMEMENRDAELKARVAEAEWGLKQRAQDSTDAYRQGQLALGAARLQAGANKPGKTEPIGRYGNIPKKYDTAIQKVYDNVMQGLNMKDELGNPAPAIKQPWRETHKQLVNAGLNPTTAAFLTTKWFPDSIASSNEKNILAMLRNRGVGPAAQKRIIAQFFGPNGWRVANSTRDGMLAPIGNMIDGVNGR